LRKTSGDSGEKRLHLDLALSAKTCGDAVEVVVVVAGMADQLVGAFGWEGVEDLGEGGGVEVAGCGDAYSALCGEDLMIADVWLAIEGGLQAVEEADLEAALEAGVRELLGEGGFEGVADGGDVGAFENFEERAGDGGEEMCVLVGVDVGDVDAGALESGNLSVCFAHDVIFADLTEEESAEEGDE